ncbi:vWA domain-containing protein [Taibaiella chishuiensis]|uniref:Uncharacterized protein YegL n=1 Tax=Taibaiella chishuiensis TaxID=1434707 RepID=A0A2P8D9N8_9BACT|nr:vWA domain-containing protein [Taibaiella chishuiensis]PSK93935.1 uncharacterized protein YegL [Taibaiella chishuiensis]
MKTSILAGALLLSSGFLFAKCGTGHTAPADAAVASSQAHNETDNTRVQVALLLDTSNSMDGLIDQAKSRLWNIINTLTTLRYKGKTPRIEIALYEYGNSRLSDQSGYIRQVTPFTTDLDLVSEQLFALRTNGGEEFCGAVIKEALDRLDWGGKSDDMKLVYIAGNEPFDQGRVSYKEVLPDAVRQGVYVHTIYCGSRKDGISELWKDGAERGGGKFFNIDSDRRVRFIETPYDARIEACNERINKTYIGYGKMGASKKYNQQQQDNNAKSLSAANYTERAVSKSKGVYKNESWDLVDRVKEDKAALKTIRQEELPAELRGKTAAELETVVAEKTREREGIQKEMAELAKQRQAYIDSETKKTGTNDDLGQAINTSILALAQQKGYNTAP